MLMNNLQEGEVLEGVQVGQQLLVIRLQMLQLLKDQVMLQMDLLKQNVLQKLLKVIRLSLLVLIKLLLLILRFGEPLWANVKPFRLVLVQKTSKPS